jgi:hypothetical protein
MGSVANGLPVGARSIWPCSRRAVAVALAAAIALALPGAAAGAVVAARPAEEFVDSIGVNTHLHYQSTSYDTLFDSAVMPKLVASGIRHVRDGAYTYDGAGPDDFYYERCRALAAAGIRFDLITAIETAGTQATDYARLPEVYRWCDGAVESFEGANEPDNQAIPDGYPDWRTQTVQGQIALYAAVRSDPEMWGVAVLGPAIAWAPQEVGDLSAYLDYGSWHPYPGGECPTCGDAYGQTIDTYRASYEQPSAGKPMIATESGYNNAVNAEAGGHRPVSEEAAATYMPRLLLELFNRGVARTYLYELIDLYDDPWQYYPEAHFGLLRSDGSEKPAYRAVRVLISTLTDPGGPFTPGALDYTLSGGTDGVHSSLLQKRDGTFFLALWLERSSYDTGARANAADDTAARGDLPGSRQYVSLQFGDGIGAATVHRFQAGGRLTSAQGRMFGGALRLGVSDRLTLVELSPASR